MYLDGIFEMADILKNLFKRNKKKQDKEKNTPKEIATLKGEPYIEIIGIELDNNNLGQGAFELDWNDTFVAKLIRAGYPGKTDADIVDNWFKEICRNVLLENYEQEQADPEKRNK